jgi:hypothetical protein
VVNRLLRHLRTRRVVQEAETIPEGWKVCLEIRCFEVHAAG